MAKRARITAGSLRHTVVLQTLTNTQNTDGEPIASWANTATLRARVEPLSGTELIEAQQVTEGVTTRVTIRPRQINQTQRFLVPKNQHDALVAVAIANSTSTSLGVTRAIGWESGDWVARMAGEYAIVKSGQGSTAMTIKRGAFGSTPTAHSTGAKVRLYEQSNIGGIDNPDERGVLMEVMCGGQR